MNIQNNVRRNLIIALLVLIIITACVFFYTKKQNTEPGEQQTEQNASSTATTTGKATTSNKPLSNVKQATIPSSASIVTAKIYDTAAAGLKSYETGLVRYNTGLASLIEPPARTDATTCTPNDMAVNDENCRIFLQFKISTSATIYHYMAYDIGPSGDPRLVYFTKQEDNSYKYIGSTPTGAVVTGDGYIYTETLSNKFHDTYQKFKIAGGKIEEVPQPYLHVGMDGVKVNKNIMLVNDTNQPLIKVSQGELVDVLLSQQKSGASIRFLVRTEGGVVGWYQYEKNMGATCDGSEAFSGICHNGD